MVLPDGSASALQAVVTPHPVLTQHLLHCYPNGVTTKNSLHPPRTVFNVEGLCDKPEGGRRKMIEHNV